MTYFEAMQLLSQFDLGAVLVSHDNFILEVNHAGDRLLHGEGKLKGRSLEEVAPDFCRPGNGGGYFNIAFFEYLAVCPPPEGVAVPDGMRLVCFRDVRNEVSHHMLETIVNLIPEPIVLCDENKRIIRINDATMRMESLMQEDVAGKDINEAYHCIYGVVDGETGDELTVPIVLRTRRPILDCRQTYKTFQGKQLDIMCNSYPIFKDGNILGVFCVTADSSRIETLGKQIIDLQEKLLERRSAPQSSSKGKLSAKYHFRDIIHQSVAMDDMIQKCLMCAKSDSPVMLYGETGTGKELVSQSIHNASNRKDGPFLAINCAAIPENLLESMLFGTEKGAYTGAESRPGLLEQAIGGTLLLDELNSMSMTLQAKLLRVLQDGMVRRVGGTEEKRVDVRMLSNVNIPPYQAILENKLREDIFYRLGVVNINIPPLRERKEDIPILARTFFLRMNQKLSKSVSGISDEVLSIFYSYDWPGNIRELQHCVEHAMNILPSDETVIRKEYLPDRILDKCGFLQVNFGESGETLDQLLVNVERGVLINALLENRGNISKTARKLGISRQNLQHRIKRNGIEVERLLREEK